MAAINFDEYFARIGFTGQPTATLDTLRELQRLHTTAIAFENLDPLMGRPVRLDLAALHDKLVNRRRGGYCYEQNIFFQNVLQSIGFSVRGVAAVAQWKRPPSEYGARIHMVLEVNVPDGRFLVDVGFGRLTLTTPLRLEPNLEQATTLETFRLAPRGDELQVQIKTQDTIWEPVYQVSLQETSAADYAVYNWFTSTNPDVIFTKHLMAARPSQHCRFGLFDNDLSIHHRDGRSERRALGSTSELAFVLQDVFGIVLPPGCEAALARVISTTKATRAVS